MSYSEMIKKVEQYSGLPSAESQEALELMVLSLSTRLNDRERQAFADELPDNLQDVVRIMRGTYVDARKDLVRQFMDLQEVDEPKARKQIVASWKALRESISGRKIEDIQSHLLPQTAAALQ